LKLENVVLDAEGHIKLTDFGLSRLLRRGEKGAGTFCGSPEYLAPEILLGKQYDKMVDFWAVGVLAYEMINGLPPFFSSNRNTLYSLIIHQALKIPAHFSAEMTSFAENMLSKEVSTRLGYSGGVQELLAHAWFASLDIDAVRRAEVTPEFLPGIVSKRTVSVSDFEKGKGDGSASTGGAMNEGGQASPTPHDVPRAAGLSSDVSVASFLGNGNGISSDGSSLHGWTEPSSQVPWGEDLFVDEEFKAMSLPGSRRGSKDSSVLDIEGFTVQNNMMLDTIPTGVDPIV
jgi:serine/threonine protein kinase